MAAAGRIDDLILKLSTYSRLGADHIQSKPIRLGSLVTKIETITQPSQSLKVGPGVLNP